MSDTPRSEPPMDCAAGAHAEQPLSAERWDAHYRDEHTPWDLGGAPPSLRALLAEPEFVGGGLDVLVPGAGRGHDALAWAQAGHRVVALDYAPRAIQAARDLLAGAHLKAEVLEVDLFDAPARLLGAFDVIWEQTCFCAIEPELRDDYVRVMATALRPGGLLVGLFWNHGKEGGPPYDLSPGEVRTRFERRFIEESYDRLPKPEGGRDPEYLGRFRRRSDDGAPSVE